MLTVGCIALWPLSVSLTGGLHHHHRCTVGLTEQRAGRVRRREASQNTKHAAWKQREGSSSSVFEADQTMHTKSTQSRLAILPSVDRRRRAAITSRAARLVVPPEKTIEFGSA
jgi:hypothetical protein